MIRTCDGSETQREELEVRSHGLDGKQPAQKWEGSSQMREEGEGARCMVYTWSREGAPWVLL